MDGGAVAVVGETFIGVARGYVQAPPDLLVVECVFHGALDVGVEPQRELAQVAGSLVGGEDGVDLLLGGAGGPNDAALVEGEGDSTAGRP